MRMADDTNNAHFVTIGSWSEVETATGFLPLVPTVTLGLPLQALRLFVRDHKLRAVPRDQQSLEAHYGAFVLTQSQTGPEEARRLAFDVAYGATPRTERVGANDARVYDRGPGVPVGDPDGRMPSVVAMAVNDLFVLLASGEFDSNALVRVARSLRPLSSAKTAL